MTIPIIHPVTVSVRVDEDGKLIERKIHREGSMPTGWIDLTHTTNEATMAMPESWRYASDGSATPLTKIELVVSTTRFLADDTDPNEQCSVMVKGDVLADNEAVEVTVNGESMTLTKLDLFIFDSDVPGVFNIAVTDPNYYTIPKFVSVMVVAAG